MAQWLRVDGLHKPTGSIDVHRVRRGLLRSTVNGHIDMDILAVLTRSREAEAEYCPGGLAYFHDWSGVHTYETAVRVAATRYMLAIPRPYTSVHVVTRSRLANMGVAAAMLSLQLAGRPFHAYIKLSSFNAEFDRHCAAAADPEQDRV